MDKQQSEFSLETRVFIAWQITKILLVDAGRGEGLFVIFTEKPVLEEAYISAIVHC